MARLQGAVVASSQCFGTSGRLALAPVADWLRNPAVQSATATLDPAWRAEVDRLVPSGEPRRARRPDPGPWSTPGSGTGSSRAWRGRCSPSAGRLLLVLDNMQWCDQETLAFLTFCLGLAPAARSWWPRRCATTVLDEDPELADWTRQDAGHRAAHRAFPQPAGGRRHGASRRGDLRAAAAGRPTRTCSTRRPAASRCTSSRRCAAASIAAARRCRPVISRPCCATGWSR